MKNFCIRFRWLCHALFLAVWMESTEAQGTDKYYYGTSTTIGSSTCPIRLCINAPSPCLTYEYRKDCSFNSSGTCTACSVPSRTAIQYYNNSAQKTTNNCDLATCPACSAGQRNNGCSASSPGTCEACAATTAGLYYPTPTSASANCVTASCSAVSPACGQTERRTGCSGSSSGSCTTCGAVPANSYWNHTLNSDTCSSTAWMTCTQDQYRTGTSTTSSGTCTACTGLTAGNYWSHALNSATCSSTAWVSCTQDQSRSGNSTTSAGTCTACTGLTSDKYWSHALNSATCSSSSKTICAAGKQNTGSSTTSAGVCTADCTGQVNGTYWIANTAWNVCTSANCVDTDCQVGQWKSGCTGTSAGTCAACTTANASQIYSTRGGWSNTCQVVNCEKVCSTGQYIVGCGTFGATSSTLTCASCNNAPVNQKFWAGQGAYLPDSCPTSACESCPNGNYRSGCGGLSRRDCMNCNNL